MLRGSYRSYAFQPTLPARGATGCLDCFHLLLGISTHAPRTGSDRLRDGCLGDTSDFNPRSPHGERHRRFRAGRWHDAISTHAPRTGSDYCYVVPGLSFVISTHAPRTGSDAADADVRHFAHISTHAPRTGSDVTRASERYQLVFISTHAPRTGSDVSVG